MSETLDINPARGRKSREELEGIQRRRRRADSLNRMVGSSLGIPEECLDKANYRYHWANDERGRLRALTVHDDYDFVTVDELGDTLDRHAFTTESDGRVSVVVQGRGSEALRAYLLKKPLEFDRHDYEQSVGARHDMMEGRVLQGDLQNDAEGKAESLDPSITYVPQGNTLGDTAPRRKGPIPRRFK